MTNEATTSTTASRGKPMLSHARRELAVPAAIVVGLLVQTAVFASGYGRLAERVDQVITRMDKQDALSQRVSELTVDLRVLLKDFDRLEREHRLLEDFVEGRIGDLPYRRPSGKED